MPLQKILLGGCTRCLIKTRRYIRFLAQYPSANYNEFKHFHPTGGEINRSQYLRSKHIHESVHTLQKKANDAQFLSRLSLPFPLQTSFCVLLHRGQCAGLHRRFHLPIREGSFLKQAANKKFLYPLLSELSRTFPCRLLFSSVKVLAANISASPLPRRKERARKINPDYCKQFNNDSNAIQSMIFIADLSPWV